MLPKLDGYQVATKIRPRRAARSHVPIIMLTAEREVEQKVRGLRAGADDYLIKPFHPAELLARIKSLLARFAPQRGAARPARRSGASSRSTAPRAASARRPSRSTRRSRSIASSAARSPRRRQPPVRRPPGVPRPRARPQEHRRRRQSAPSIDADLVRQVMVKHDSGIDLLLAPPSPETAELVTPGAPADHPRAAARRCTTTSSIDIDKRLDDINLGILEAAETDLRGHDRRPVVPQERPARPRDDRTTSAIRPSKRPARPQPLERVHRHQRQERRGRAQAARSSTRSSTSTAARSARSTPARRSCSRKADSALGGRCSTSRGRSTSRSRPRRQRRPLTAAARHVRAPGKRRMRRRR